MTQAFNLSQLANKVNSSGQLDVSTGLNGSTPVANGGTGQTTYTNGQLLIGNTTGNTLTKATLTAGTGVTITNSTGAITIAASAGQFQYALYTSGTTTWTAPTGVTKVKVICIGGGGGGGGWWTYSEADGQSGGYGGIAIGIYTVTPGTGYSVVVGAGGAGSNSTNGSAGGSSSFGSFLSASGGGGGTFAAGGRASAGAGASGITANTNISYGGGGDFLGSSSRELAPASTAGEIWAASLTRLPGAGGAGGEYPPLNTAMGGTGGVVYIVYVG